KPAPAIPDHDGAAAIFASRDSALERVVLDRMVLDVDGKAFFAGVETRAARHRPALHHPVEFEPQIVMQPPCGMFLNHIAVTAAGTLPAARLRRHAELPLFSVSLESHRHQLLRLRRFASRARANCGAGTISTMLSRRHPEPWQRTRPGPTYAVATKRGSPPRVPATERG